MRRTDYESNNTYIDWRLGNNEPARQAKVIARIFDGTRPDMVYLTTDYEHE